MKLLTIRIPLWAALLLVGLLLLKAAFSQVQLANARSSLTSLRGNVAVLEQAVEGRATEIINIKSQYRSELAICRQQLSDRDEIRYILSPELKPVQVSVTPDAQSDKLINCTVEQSGAVAEGVQAKPMEIIDYETSTAVIGFINNRTGGM